MTRITKKLRLPNVTAYILAGILIGPYGLDLIPAGVVQGMNFLPDIALAFIAFSTGEYFRMETLKKNGTGVVLVTFLEAALATVLVFVLCVFVLRLSLPFAVVLSALAAATAPASTMMTIRQVHAKGPFVETLLQVVALDDIIALVAYSVAISIAIAEASEGASLAGNVLLPFLINVGVLFLGAFFGFLTMLFMKNRNSSDNRLIIAVTMLFSFCGICALLETSPLLGCMAMATVYINLTDDERLFRQLNYFSPPILMLFFVRSGISFDLGALLQKNASIGGTPLLLIGVGYFLVRILGKYGGAFLGCQIIGSDKKIRNYLGLALIPQAGVAIGLAELGARTLGGDSGRALYTIILASSILYELIGPSAAKAALYLSGSYSNDLEEMVKLQDQDDSESAGGQEQSPVERLIGQIQKIQEELSLEGENRDEAVFSEEAEEHYQEMIKPEPAKKKQKKEGGSKKGDKRVGKKLREKARKKAGEKSSDRAKEKAGDRVKEKAGEKAGDRVKEKPGEKAGDRTKEKPGEKPEEVFGMQEGDKK